MLLRLTKTLSHAAIESPEVLNRYRGNVVTGADGKAIIKLPAYYAAINKDPSYQLTAIGVDARAFVTREIAGNEFEIETSQPGVKVSWAVESVRNDAYMIANPYQVERDKPAETAVAPDASAPATSPAAAPLTKARFSPASGR